MRGMMNDVITWENGEPVTKLELGIVFAVLIITVLVLGRIFRKK